jgi:ubiquinone/menaquinone biosynthesis C-methylase UbiE
MVGRRRTREDGRVSSQQKEWLAGVFDRAAPAYDRIGPAYHEHFGRRLVALADLPAGADLLDVGCGRGAVLRAAAGRAGSLTGVDVSPGMLEQARASGLDGVRLEVMDAEQLAFADGAFDAVTAAFLLFFLPDPERAAAEFHRVLRPAGRIAVSTWGDDDPRWAWADDLMADVAVDRRAIQRPFASPEEVRALLTGAGFGEATAHREDWEIRFADADQWWDWQWSFSLRGILEQLDPATVAALRADATARLRATAADGGHPMLLSAWITTAVRP